MKTLNTRCRQNQRPLRFAWSATALFAAIFAAVLLGGVSIQAGVTYNWISTTPDNYTNPSAYSPTGVPGIADTNIIGNATVSSATVYYTNALSDPLSTNRLQSLLIGNVGGADTFTMNDGVLLITNGTAGVAGGATTAFDLGNVNGATGTFTQNGGTLVVARPSTGLLYYQDSAEIGNSGNGAYTINNGTAKFLCGIETGRNGTSGSSGTFTVNGGTVIDNGWFGVGGGGGSSDSGIFNLTAGTLYVLRNPSADGTLALAQTGKGIAEANISGGTLYCAGIRFYNNGSTAPEMINISGGDLYIGYFGINTNSGATTKAQTVNISGGTFHSADMLPITTATIGQISTILSDGTNWTWAPSLAVNLTNTSFLVNEVAGPGYVTFEPEVNRTITLNNAWSGVGGLVLNGPGTLVLGSADTYTGGTTINQGTLSLANILALPSTGNVTGAGNVLVNSSSATVNVADNLQNSGSIVINAGALVVNGSILNSSGITNASSTGPLVAQGTISSPIQINTNSSLYVGATSLAGTLNASNVTLNGKWTVKINTATTPGGGINDLLVCSNLTLGANSVLNIAPLTAPSLGTYVIAKYSGTLTGTFGMVTNVTRDTMHVDYSTPGEIDLVVDSVNAANLTWAAPPIGTNYISWDVNSSTDWVNSGVLDKFQQQDAVTFNNPPGTTNRVAISATVLPSSVTITGTEPYIFSGTGHISGGTSLTYDDTNTSGMYIGNGNDFTGPVYIENGVLQMGTGGVSGLGAGTNSDIYATNNGTLDLNDISPGSKTIVIAGSGYNGQGALNDSSTSTAVHYCVTNLALAGPATIGASGRWDFPSSGVNDLGGTLSGNGYDLTKVGPGQTTISPSGGIGLGDIDIQSGTLTFGPHVTDFGDPAKTITVESGASLYFYGTPALASKFLTLDDGAAVLSGLTSPESAPQFTGPVTLSGNSTINTILADMTFSNVISGTGGFVKIGTNVLRLNSINTYTGPTYVNAGSVALGTNASIAGSPLIQLAAGTVLDASAPSALTLNSGQMLAGSGSVFGNVVNAGAGTTLSPGSGRTPGTLTFTNNLTLNGDTNVIKLGNDGTQTGGANDLLQINNTLTLNGVSTINVIPLGGGFDNANPYTVMQAGSISGTVANLTVLNNHTRYMLTPSISGQDVQVIITGNAANLLWTGTMSADWDLVTSNWLNLGTASADTFFNEDSPIFDDSSGVTSVTIPGNVTPGGIYMSNVVNTYTFSGGGVISGALNMEGNGSMGGTLVLAMSNAPTFTAIDSSFGTLVFNLKGLTNYTVNAPISDNYGGSKGTIIFGGTNTVVLTGQNYDFSGTLAVTNGILQYTNGLYNLGYNYNNSAEAPLYATNGGTVDFNGVYADTRTIYISGNGYNGMGALYDSKSNTGASGGAPNGNGAFANLTFVGDAAIGCSTNSSLQQQVIDGELQQVNGNGFKLTKVEPGSVFFYQQSDGDTHLGDIDVAQGRLGFQGTVSSGAGIAMGDPTKTVTVEPGAMLTFYQASNGLDTVHFGLDKIMVLNGGYAALDSGGGNASFTNSFDGPVFMTGTNIIVARSDLYLWNGIMDTNGSGGFVLGNSSGFSSGAALYLEGTNTYSGPTIVSNATVVVGANSSLGDSSLIQINSGATLNVSAMSASLNLGANQTMIGNGTVVGPSSGINFNDGSTLAVGFPDAGTYTLTMSGNLAFSSGSINVVKINKTTGVANDEVVGLNSVTMGGTLVITNVGANLLVPGDTIKLFDAVTYSGYVTTIIPAHPNGDSSLSWDLGQLDVNGTLGVFSGSGLAASLTPTNTTLYVGQTFTYPALVHGTPPFYYQWYHGASPVLYATNSTFPVVAALGTDIYSFVVTNNTGSVTSNPAMLTGIAMPTNLYPATVLSNSPIAYWRLDETSGTIAYDYVGGHDGSYTNVQQGVLGYNPSVDPDYAALFGTNTILMTAYPSNSYVGEIDGSSAGLPNINFSQPSGSNAEFSVEAWVNGGASQISGAGIVVKGSGNGGEQFAIDDHTGFRFYVRNITGTSYPAQSTNLPDGNWHHLVGVCDEANGFVHLYVDGIDVADDAIPAGSGLLASPADAALPAASLVNIGARTSNGTITNFDSQFVGTIDEVALYNYALSPSQIVVDYHAGIASGVNTTPTNIVFSVSGNQLTLSWPQDHTGWQLQAQTNSLSVGISTNWVDFAGSTTTNQVVIPINLTNGSVFYRLVYPPSP